MSRPNVRRIHQAVMAAALFASVGGAGDAIEQATTNLSEFGKGLIAAGAWALWGLALMSTLVRLPATLTTLRISATTGLVAIALAALVGDLDAASVVWAVTPPAALATVSLSPVVGHEWIDGASYGDEIRFTLRTPLALALIGLPLGWAVLVTGVLTGPILLANERWLAGAIATVIGFYAASIGARALHGLARRWLVMVPAGLVLHDHLATREAFLMIRSTVTDIRPTPNDTNLGAYHRLDATGDAPGTSFEIVLTDGVECVPRPERGRTAEIRKISSVLIVPTRGTAFVEVARSRGLRN
ncbi:MAG: hypothetical protein GY708_28040 [Actinomycetia bacterium]|nr:hypothetical protein [Actinomycetes bacterium]